MRVTPRQLRRIIREAFEDHIRRRPKEPMLIEIEWESGQKKVITVPEDIRAEYNEEYWRDRWDAQAWMDTWLEDEFGISSEHGDFVQRWRWHAGMEDS
jgi:predicted RNA-binding protein